MFSGFNVRGDSSCFVGSMLEVIVRVQWVNVRGDCSCSVGSM